MCWAEMTFIHSRRLSLQQDVISQWDQALLVALKPTIDCKESQLAELSFPIKVAKRSIEISGLKLDPRCKWH